MATYFDDCTSLSGWTENEFTPGAVFVIESGEIKGPDSSLSSEVLYLNAVNTDGDRDDVEILFKFRTTAWNSTHYVGSVRQTDDGTSSGFYRYLLALRSNAIRTYVASATTNLGTQIASVSKTLSTSTDYWVRFRVVGTTVQARIWADGDSEPGTWDCDNTNSTLSGVGRVGISCGNTGCDHYYSAFGVGTNGDTAPSSGGGGATVTLSSPTATATGQTTANVGCTVTVA